MADVQADTITNALIRQRIDEWTRAVGAKDIDSAMSFYARTIESFDIDGPLRYAGVDHKRQAWQNVFAAYTGPIGYEVRELSIATDGDLAVAHSVNHVSVDQWPRCQHVGARHDVPSAN